MAHACTFCWTCMSKIQIYADWSPLNLLQRAPKDAWHSIPWPISFPHLVDDLQASPFLPILQVFSPFPLAVDHLASHFTEKKRCNQKRNCSFLLLYLLNYPLLAHPLSVHQGQPLQLDISSTLFCLLKVLSSISPFLLDHYDHEQTHGNTSHSSK